MNMKWVVTVLVCALVAPPAGAIGAFADGRKLVPAVQTNPPGCQAEAEFANALILAQMLGSGMAQQIEELAEAGCQILTKTYQSAQIVGPGAERLAKPERPKPRPRGRGIFPEDHPETRKCVTRAAKVFGIETLPLYLILDVEGGTIGETSRANSNGTYDIGPMQINSSWLPRLEAIGIRPQEIQNKLCVNILVGAWIYTMERMHTPSMAMAIAKYHSPTPRYQRRYLQRIAQAIVRRQRRAEAQETSECLTQSSNCESRSIASSTTIPTSSPSQPTPSGI